MRKKEGRDGIRYSYRQIMASNRGDRYLFVFKYCRRIKKKKNFRLCCKTKFIVDFFELVHQWY